jgi:carboxymethylenebutenolidase
MNQILTLIAVLTLASNLQQALAQQATPAQIPPGAEGAKEQLDKSPRHGEYADIAVPGMDAKLKSFVVYPERKENAGVVIVIHEIFGLTDWVRAVADQLAAAGFIAIAPDLLSGRGPNGGGTAEMDAAKQDVRSAIRGLKPDEVNRMLDAVRAYGAKLPAANGKSATIGFCWGGTASFQYATHQPALNAAIVYYGTSPSSPDAFKNIKAPVLGLYGSDDARVNATIEPAQNEMKKLGKPYMANVYEGAGHGFLRQQTGRDGANAKASSRAWQATVAFLNEHLK